MAQRIAFLGPAGTFSEDALLSAAATADIEPQPRPSVYAAIRAVVEGEADRALVPFENSIEGAVRSTPWRSRRPGSRSRVSTTTPSATA